MTDIESHTDGLWQTLIPKIDRPIYMKVSKNVQMLAATRAHTICLHLAIILGKILLRILGGYQNVPFNTRVLFLYAPHVPVAFICT